MNKSSVLLFAFTVILFASCRKDKEADKVWDNTSSKDNDMSESLFSDMFKVVDDVSSNTEGIRGDGIGCIDNITVDTTSWPRTVLIDFGEDNCSAADGRIRKGQIFISYSGRYRDEGTVITVTPENYRVDDYLVEGSKIITNLGLNDNGHLHYSIHVDGSITAPGNAYTCSTVSDRIRTWVEGSGTLSIWDDAYEITGTANGVNRFGDPYHVNITQPLRAEIGCRWIVSGTLALVPSDGATRVVNFGSGACNAGFTVIVNDHIYPINGGN